MGRAFPPMPTDQKGLLLLDVPVCAPALGSAVKYVHTSDREVMVLMSVVAPTSITEPSTTIGPHRVEAIIIGPSPL